MIEAFIRTMLGPLAFILDWVKANPGYFALIIFAIIALYVAGRIQLHNIKIKTERLIVSLGEQEIKSRPNITINTLYKHIYPSWAQEVRKWGFFIPHRWDFFPILVTPENVKDRLPFNPEWVSIVLNANDIHLANDSKNSEES
jgi:hypothetical protein